MVDTPGLIMFYVLFVSLVPGATTTAGMYYYSQNVYGAFYSREARYGIQQDEGGEARRTKKYAALVLQAAGAQYVHHIIV
jgi:hypothetical protein